MTTEGLGGAYMEAERLEQFWGFLVAFHCLINATMHLVLKLPPPALLQQPVRLSARVLAFVGNLPLFLCFYYCQA